jgi:centromere protein C
MTRAGVRTWIYLQVRLPRSGQRGRHANASFFPTGAGPGPRTLLKEQRNIQYPLPRSRSPIKTTFLSPARRNPHLAERFSSPVHEDRETTVTRKITFPSKATGRVRPAGARTNGHGVNGAAPESEEEAEEDEPEDVGEEAEDSVHVVGGVEEEPEDDPPVDEPDVEDGEEDEEPIPKEPPTLKRPRGRPRTSLPDEIEPEAPVSSAKKSRGRPPQSAKKPVQEKEPEEDSQPVRGSRKRRSLRSDDGAEEEPPDQEDDEEPARQAKRPRVSQEPKAAAAAAKHTNGAKTGKPAKPEKSAKNAAFKPADAAAPKARGRPKTKPASRGAGDAEAGEASFMELQKGPPMPKRRGLVSIKRDPDVIVQTRAGRQSFRPLHWWAGDKVITEIEERWDIGASALDFVTSSTKEVFRAPEEDTRPRRGPRGKARPKGKSRGQMQQIEEEEQEPFEDWELDRGVIEGEVMGWEPEYERHPPADDDQVHVSETCRPYRPRRCRQRTLRTRRSASPRR